MIGPILREIFSLIKVLDVARRGEMSNIRALSQAEEIKSMNYCLWHSLRLTHAFACASCHSRQNHGRIRVGPNEVFDVIPFMRVILPELFFCADEGTIFPV